MSTESILIITATFVLAGFVKGVIGLGLPLVSIAILAATLGLKEAMALMLVPTFITNLWQGVRGPELGPVLRRLWPFLVFGFGMIFAGAAALTKVDNRILSALLGLCLGLYALFGLMRPRASQPGAAEWWLSPLMGGFTGLFAGLTGVMSFPGVPYLQALGLNRESLIQAMGLWFTIGAVALALSLQSQSLLPSNLAMMSAAAVIPAFFGMMLGQITRQRLSEQRFRLVFLWGLLVLGFWNAAPLVLR